MRHPRRGFSILLLLAFTLSLAAAPGASAAPRGQGFLTGPSDGDALDIAVAYLRANHAKFGLKRADVDAFVVTDRYSSTHNGVTHLYLRQTFSSLEVVGAEVNVNVTADGRIISLDSSFIANLAAKVRQGTIRSAEASVKSAARSLGLQPPSRLTVEQRRGGTDREVVFATNGISQESITARLVYQPTGSVVRLAWQLDIYEPDGDHWWNMRVDAATGKVLARDDYASHADGSYRVFEIPKENPDEGDRTLQVNPATDASPLGWITDGQTLTQGNNALAYTDRNNDNLPDDDPATAGIDGFADGGAGLDFDFPLDLTGPPEDYQDAAVTNLFYWNNVIHDVLHGYGFDEKSGNFQLDNFGPSNGKGGDPVRAEAQDGSGRNNANFFTPPDGFRPRMQMFEWRDSAPNPLEVEGVGTFSGPMAGFGASLATTGPISGELVLANDGVGATTDGCSAFPADSLVGKIPLIDRGTCNFTVKVKNAQVAGAQTAIVANNAPGAPFGMGGADPTITIPSIMISLADANTIKPELPAAATLSPNPDLQPDRDSDLDSGVITHEYGHGVSNRLTGGPGNAGCLQNAEQMGEGWSDFLALVLTAEAGDEDIARGVGNYVVFQDASGIGIRPTAYSRDMAVSPSTYETVIEEAGTPTLTIPHGVGYVWATMLWEMYGNLVDEHGFNPDIYAAWSSGGNNLALQLVIDGMKFQPCSPGFVQGRDAVLDADLALTGGDNQCLIWGAFAKRGLGFSAEQRSSKKTADGTAAFDLPPACGGEGAGVLLPVAPAALARLAAGVNWRRRFRR